MAIVVVVGLRESEELGYSKSRKRPFLSCTTSLQTRFDTMVALSLLCDVVRGAKGN